MNVALGTIGENIIKYVKEYFDTTDLIVSITSAEVNSEIDKQLVGLKLTVKGAENRAEAAKESIENCKVGLGLEEGLLKNDNSYSLICVASIYNGIQFFNGQSKPIKLPPKVSEQIKNDGQFGKVICEFNNEGFNKETRQELINRQKSFAAALDKAYKNFIENRPYRSGAIAYIFDKNNKILIDQLTDYAFEDWNFPGGGRNKDESALENIHRELEEELNITKNDLKLIAQAKQPIKYDFPVEMLQDQHIAAILYKGQIKDQFIFRFVGNIKTIQIDPKELRDYNWVDIADLKKYLTFPNQYKISIETIKKYLNTLSSTKNQINQKSSVNKYIKEVSDFFELPRIDIKVHLIQSRKEFDKLLSKKTENWLVGFTDKNKICILDRSKFETESIHSKSHFDKTLKHEISHIYYKQLKPSGHPNWLDEGVACYIANQNQKQPKNITVKTLKKYYKNSDKNIYNVGRFMVGKIIEDFGKERLFELIKSKSETDLYSKLKSVFEWLK